MFIAGNCYMFQGRIFKKVGQDELYDSQNGWQCLFSPNCADDWDFGLYWMTGQGPNR